MNSLAQIHIQFHMLWLYVLEEDPLTFEYGWHEFHVCEIETHYHQTNNIIMDVYLYI